MAAFDEEKYKVASQKAIEFIKRQLNVNNYTLFPTLRTNYDDAHMSTVFANVPMPPGAKVIFPKYIYCDQFYDEVYQGVCSGHHQNTGDARHNLGVEVVVYTDARYAACVCPLHSDGSWRTEEYFKETDYYGIDGTVYKTETYWYVLDKEMNDDHMDGLKEFRLKYYKWLDEDGSEIDVDNLPGLVTWEADEMPTDEFGEPLPLYLLKTETYRMTPEPSGDEAIDDAVPKYADYDTVLYVFADVEYNTEAESIIYDGVVQSSDLPSNPPVIPAEPAPYIKDVIVMPGAHKGKLIFSWVTNFPGSCLITVNGTTKRAVGENAAGAYFSYSATFDVPAGSEYTYLITGEDAEKEGEFRYPDNNRYLLISDPHIVDDITEGQLWTVKTAVNPALTICLGDAVDASTNAIARSDQYSLFTKRQRSPIAMVRGEHEDNPHFLAHYAFPNGSGANYYFSHDGVLFICVDTNDSPNVIKPFIQRALASQSYTWAILCMHYSFFSTSEASNSAKVKTLRNSLTNFIVNETNIDLVISGHEHFFCRTRYPGKLFFTVPTCTAAKFYRPDNEEAQWGDVTIYREKPMYTVMDVSNTTLTLQTLDITGALIDTCEVTK